MKLLPIILLLLSTNIVVANNCTNSNRYSTTVESKAYSKQTKKSFKLKKQFEKARKRRLNK